MTIQLCEETYAANKALKIVNNIKEDKPLSKCLGLSVSIIIDNIPV